MLPLSIIVHVSNAGPYLPDCLESILDQTFLHFELLLVDDGSTDMSPALCDKYAKKDSRIRVFHREKEGFLRSVLFALQEAEGKYAGIVKGCDKIHPQMYSMMVRKAQTEEADLVTCSYMLYDNDYSLKRIKEYAPEGTYRDEELDELRLRILGTTYREGSTFPFICNKLYDREELIKVLANVDMTIGIHEDELATYPYLMQTRCMCTLSRRCLYFDRQRKKALSHEEAMERIDSLKKVIAAFENMAITDPDFLPDEMRNRRSLGFLELITDEKYCGLTKLFSNVNEKVKALSEDDYWSEEFESPNPLAFTDIISRWIYIECTSDSSPHLTTAILAGSQISRKAGRVLARLSARSKKPLPWKENI